MIIVTGGAGFIGANLIWHLNQLGRQDIMIVDNLANTEKWKNLANLRFAAYRQRDDFLAELRGRGLPAQVTHVIHLGACSSTTEKDADFLMRNNLQYSQILCEKALETCARFIFASSAATYGAGENGFSDTLEHLPNLLPLNMYGYSKHLFDLWCMDNALLDKVASLKFFNVYGPDEYHKGSMKSMVCRAVEQMKTSGKIRLFKSAVPEYNNGEFKRDFVYSKDCAAIIHWLMENPERNGVFNVGTGKARSWNDLATAVLAALDISRNDFDKYIEYVEMPENIRSNYQYYTQADLSQLRAAGCSIPFKSLEDGVNDYVRRYLLKPNPYLNSLR